MNKQKRKYSPTVVAALIILVAILAFMIYAIGEVKSEYNGLLLYNDSLLEKVDDLENRVASLENANKVQTDSINTQKADTNQESTSTLPKGEIVWKTKSGKKYHKEDCGSVNSDSVAISLEEATVAGLEPCKKCFK